MNALLAAILGDYMRTLYQDRIFKLKNGSDTARWAADEIERLIEDLARCRHQASYSVGDSEALKVQLEKVREIANESLSKV